MKGWQTDFPDDDVTVLIRSAPGDYPVWVGFRSADQWYLEDGQMADVEVTGWIHLEDAAKILDAHSKPL